jgi:hypothetical protein
MFFFLGWADWWQVASSREAEQWCARQFVFWWLKADTRWHEHMGLTEHGRHPKVAVLAVKIMISYLVFYSHYSAFRGTHIFMDYNGLFFFWSTLETSDFQWFEANFTRTAAAATVALPAGNVALELWNRTRTHKNSVSLVVARDVMQANIWTDGDTVGWKLQRHWPTTPDSFLTVSSHVCFTLATCMTSSRMPLSIPRSQSVFTLCACLTWYPGVPFEKCIATKWRGCFSGKK